MHLHEENLLYTVEVIEKHILYLAMLSASGKIREIDVMQTILQCRALEAEMM